MTLLRELWSVLTPAQRRRVVGAQAISLAMAASALVSIAGIAPFFAAVSGARPLAHQRALQWLYVHTGFTSEHAFATALAVLFVALVIVSNLVSALGTRAMNRIAHRIGNELQATLFGEYLERPYLFHVGTGSATLFNNVINEAYKLSEGTLQSVLTLITNATTGFMIIMFVILVSPVIALSLLAGLGGGYVMIYLSVRARLLLLGRAHSRAWSEEARIARESFAGIKEILLLADKSRFREGFERASAEVGRTGSQIWFAGHVPRYAMECIAICAFAVVALALNARPSTAGTWLAELSLLGFATYRLLPVLQQVFVSVVTIRANRAGVTSIAQDLIRARSPRLPTLETSDGATCIGGPRKEIRLVQVSFQYSPERPAALANVDLRVPAHTMVGIVGPNGSGKTTLMDVIAGLLPPTSGEVRIDDVAISAESRSAWISKIAYVPQHLFLLDASVAENIAFGVRAGAIDRARVARAAELAHLDRFIGGLPRGYDERVGEGGFRLSGGQRQKIAIARALYRGASILLLDEATGALDGVAEREILATLLELRRSCTIFLISHRPSTIRACDVIVNLDAGRIVGIEPELALAAAKG
jgi:ABC-type multidrug transport system fused ATPase/permease subunit